MKKTPDYLVIKTIYTDHNGIAHPDYQLIENKDRKSVEQARQEVLDHVLSTHPEYPWLVDIYDADNMPPDAIPDGTTLTLAVIKDFPMEGINSLKAYYTNHF